MKRVFGSSPSFVIVVGGVILLGGGYAAKRIWWPNDVARSDRIVRQFNQDAGRVVGDLRRALRELARGAESNKAAATTAVEEMQRRADQALADLEAVADQAIDELDALEEIAVRTRRNRIDRLHGRLRETRDYIADTLARARQDASERVQP